MSGSDMQIVSATILMINLDLDILKIRERRERGGSSAQCQP